MSGHTASIMFVQKFLAVLAKELGTPTLGMQQLAILLTLYANGQMSQGQLEEATGVGKSANGRNVRVLGAEKRAMAEGRWVRTPGLGLVDSFTNPDNNREKILKLTPKGRRVLERAAGAAAKLLE